MSWNEQRGPDKCYADLYCICTIIGIGPHRKHFSYISQSFTRNMDDDNISNILYLHHFECIPDRRNYRERPGFWCSCLAIGAHSLALEMNLLRRKCKNRILSANYHWRPKSFDNTIHHPLLSKSIKFALIWRTKLFLVPHRIDFDMMEYNITFWSWNPESQTENQKSICCLNCFAKANDVLWKTNTEIGERIGNFIMNSIVSEQNKKRFTLTKMSI